MTRIAAPKVSSRRRSRAIENVLRREPRGAASHRALSRQARETARLRGAADRRRAARAAARTKGPAELRREAVKAAAARRAASR